MAREPHVIHTLNQKFSLIAEAELFYINNTRNF
jgi:hypothetical protein